MASGKSDWAENEVLNYLLDDVATSRPTAWYVALGTGNTDDAFTEVTNAASPAAPWSTYLRQEITAVGGAPPTWSITASAATNSGAVTFPAGNQAGGPTLLEFAIFSASSGGNMIYRGDIGTGSGLQVNTDVIPEFASGDIDITED